MLWESILSCNFLDAVKQCNGVCAIPIGCLEAHGTHLPLGCDTIKALEFVRRAAEEEPVCVFPPLYFGEKSGAGEFPGTVIFPTPLICQILEQCCNEIARNGFKKIVLVTSHGGNRGFVNTFCRYMLTKKNDFLVYHYYQSMPGPSAIVAQPEQFPYLSEQEFSFLKNAAENKIADGGHGGFVETSNLYDICPEWIDLNRFNTVDGSSTHRMDEFSRLKIDHPFTWMANFPNSLDSKGNYPTEMITPNIAKAFAQATVSLTKEVFHFLREETISTDYHAEWLKKQIPHTVE